MTEQRQSGRQGPPTDPNRDGCGPVALMLLTFVLLTVLGMWLS